MMQDTGAVHYTAVLDARLFDPLERLPRILQSLQAMAAGETLLVVTANPPERLEAFLDREFGAGVSVEPVKAGPPVWQTCLRRD